MGTQPMKTNKPLNNKVIIKNKDTRSFPLYSKTSTFDKGFFAVIVPMKYG